jgi:hypothetical protein
MRTALAGPSVTQVIGTSARTRLLRPRTCSAHTSAYPVDRPQSLPTNHQSLTAPRTKYTHKPDSAPAAGNYVPCSHSCAGSVPRAIAPAVASARKRFEAATAASKVALRRSPRPDCGHTNTQGRNDDPAGGHTLVSRMHAGQGGERTEAEKCFADSRTALVHEMSTTCVPECLLDRD